MQQLVGTVIGTNTAKTVKVEVIRRWAHPLYHKTITKKKNYLAQGEIKVAVGDRVVLLPCRPISKKKKWRILKKI